MMMMMMMIRLPGVQVCRACRGTREIQRSLVMLGIRRGNLDPTTLRSLLERGNHIDNRDKNREENRNKNEDQALE
jgi:hypothetical protein